MPKRNIAIVLLLLVVLALLLWRLWPAPPTPVTPAQPQQCSPVSGERKGAPIREIPASNLAPANTPPKSEAPPKEPVEEKLIQRITLHFVDEQGQPVPHWEFCYAIFEGVGDVVAPDDGAVVGNRCPNIATSDSSGQYVIVDETWSRALLICPSKGGMILADQGDGGRPIYRNEGYWFLHGDREITVKLKRTTQLWFSVSYEDGLPYDGNVAWVSAKTNGVGPGAISHGVRNGNFSADVAASADEVRVGVDSMRAGFRTFNQWTFLAPSIPGYAKPVIPRDPNQVVFIVHLDKWPKDDDVEIKIISPLNATSDSGRVSGGETWQTIKVLWWVGDFFVDVKGKQGIWVSPFFEVEKGKTYEFWAAPMKVATLVCRMIDPDGKPLLNTQMHTMRPGGPGWYLQRNHIAKTNYTGAGWPPSVKGGADGVARMTNLPPGEREFYFEVWGHERAARKVNLIAGETVDVGDIVLAPATGRIEVNLINRDPELTYGAALKTPFGIGLIELVSKIEGPSVVFENVASRKYMIHIGAMRNIKGKNVGRGKNIDIELQAGQKLTIDVDVSDIDPADSR